jgi:hypothetical protein
MAYDLDLIAKKVIEILENCNDIVTNLQVYGRIGVGKDWFYSVLLKSDYSETIKNLINKNKALGSITATDCLRKAALLGNIKAAETYGRIVDPCILKALAPNLHKEDDENNQTILSKDEMMNEIERFLSSNGIK